MHTAATISTPGALQAQGQLYLRRTVEERQALDGTLQYLYPLIERVKINGVWDSQSWLGIWSGESARQFYQAHWAALKPGAALDVNIERVRIHVQDNSAELRCRIHSARLATPRWADKAEPETDSAAHPVPAAHPPETACLGSPD